MWNCYPNLRKFLQLRQCTLFSIFLFSQFLFLLPLKVQAQQLRLISATVSPQHSFSLRFLLTNAGGDPTPGSHSYTVQLHAESSIAPAIHIPSIAKLQNDSTPLDVIFCIEHTEGTFPFYSAISLALRSALPLLPKGSTLSMLFYNHEIYTTEIQASIDQEKHFPLLSLPPVSNLTALFRALYHSITISSASPVRRKWIITIGRGMDNASLFITAADVIAAAREQNIPIFSILLTNEESSATAALLSAATGAQTYRILTPSSLTFTRIFRELFTASKYFYRIDLDPSSTNRLLEHPQFTLTVTMSDTSTELLRSNALIFAQQIGPLAPMHQILATFGFGETQIPPTFYEQIDRLYTLLRYNPDQSIILIGHASARGNEASNQRISYARAAAVKAYLMRKGISSDRISCVGVGSREPMYFHPESSWQERLNQRVELRWRDPRLYPYQLYAERAISEEEALRYAQQWKSRGLPTYIKPILYKDRTYFQVILWGFESREHAEATRKLLQQQYHTFLQLLP